MANELNNNNGREKAMSELLEAWSLRSQKFDWQHKANCKGNGDVFFFERGYSGDKIAKAKALCSKCKVKKDCLDFALENRMEYGIWGGKTSNERLMHLGIHSWGAHDAR